MAHELSEYQMHIILWHSLVTGFLI